MGDTFAQVLRDQALVTSRTGRQVGLMEGLLHQNITIAIGKASEKTFFFFIPPDRESGRLTDWEGSTHLVRLTKIKDVFSGDFPLIMPKKLQLLSCKCVMCMYEPQAQV